MSSTSSSCGSCAFHRYAKIGAAVAVAAFAVYAVSKNCSGCCGGKKADAPATTAAAAAGVAAGENSALIFIKPHAQVGGLINDFIVSELRAAKIRVVSSGQLPGRVVDEKGCIDEHYASIAAYAMRVAPKDLPVSAEKKAEFAAKFGVGYDEACAAGTIVNVPAAMERLGLDATALASAFEAAKATTGFKLAPGCYVAKVGENTMCINAFYGPMRSEYCEPRAVVTWFVIAWPEAQLSWADFRGKVLGATDPTKAEATSVRAKILARYTELQLPFVPSMGRNCVHGSASPLEAFNERRIWVTKSGAAVAATAPDAFATALLARGVTATQLDWFCSNPTVEGGKPLFDLVEDMNTSECIETLVAVAAKQK